MYNPKIKMFFNPNMVLQKHIAHSTSKSPEKPKRLLNFLAQNNLLSHFEINPSFQPFKPEDFRIAHTEEYVHAIFNGLSPLCLTNGLPYSKELVESVRWTNASLHYAIKHSIEHPEQVCFSPGCGFHHATPNAGGGFCTFSGQVISAVKIYRETGKRCAYLDLDGHFGNSIENSRGFVHDLDKAIPRGFNFNIEGHEEEYLDDLHRALGILREAIFDKQIDYVVWCHGADSHEWDDLGSNCSTKTWIACSKLFYSWIKQINEVLGRPFPITLALFGGYRRDHYGSVLALHTSDLTEALNILCGQNIKYIPEIKAPK